jgi:hypothetical protein
MTLVVFEQFSRVAPLGVRFWDVAKQAPVTGGLIVTARTPQGRRLPMFANRQGVYVLQNVPGLRPFETGDGSQTFWEAVPPAQPYTLEVRDTEARFHHFTLAADVPTREIFTWDCGSSPPSSPPSPLLHISPGYVPAYSAPNRSVPGGMAVVRADLYDPAQDVPAAWAVLEVLLDGAVIGRGIADARGCVVAVFPYPEPVDTTPESPLGFGVPLTEQTWNLTLRAFYAPTDPVPAVPDLCTVLNQPEADLWLKWINPANKQALAGVVLLYSQETIAVSFDNANKPLSRLYITPV